MNSWGNLAYAPPREVLRPPSRQRRLSAVRPLLVRGNGRSYGDVCINSGGTLIDARGLDHFMAFDVGTGVLRVEAGALLADILDLVTPHGWFLPVTPGTRFITVGGAIANDVHGKNHHRAGTFGRHLNCFELLRSDGQRLQCSATENSQLFAASIGGLGLTGLITWAEICLQRVASLMIEQVQQRFHGLEEFFALNGAAEAGSEHTVAWIDCLAAKPRGIFISGNHVSAGAPADASRSPGGLNPGKPSRSLRIPVTLPFSPVNRLSLRAFNSAYFKRPLAQGAVHYLPFFYPLDGILEWNRMYGRAGFFQYQCVLPGDGSALAEMLRSIAASGEGSFLAVLKTFGDVPSPGLLSFPRPGANLALDFPNRGSRTLRLFERLDAIVAAAGGRLYAAKDARMPGSLFRAGYPALEQFVEFIDPAFSSNFWRRVMEQT